MNEEKLGIGARLRAAREEKGWTVHDISSRLRLRTRQIEAIENEDFSSLGQPVFARGFVRNYAKLVGVDPDELLKQMAPVEVSRVQEIESLPFISGRAFWKSPWVWGGLSVAALVIAIPLALYFWLIGDIEENPAPAVGQAVLPPAPLQGATTALPAETALAKRRPGAAPAVPQAVPMQSDAPAATAPATTVSQPDSEKSAALRLQFDDLAWVQVRDGSGRIVLAGLNPAGTAVTVNGKAPFHLVVGNARRVRVYYKGRAIDLKPFTSSADVARLTLNP